MDEEDGESLQNKKSIGQRCTQWITLDGSPSSEKKTSPKQFLDEIECVIQGKKVDIGSLAFRDPNSFIAGELRHHRDFWELITRPYPFRHDVLEWISDGVDVLKFLKPFKGTFCKEFYDSTEPLEKVFKNHNSCKGFSSFISSTIQDRIATGAIHVWGEVGQVRPPRVVLPLTVEPTNPDYVLTHVM